jgi:hypothetical protein
MMRRASALRRDGHERSEIVAVAASAHGFKVAAK